jgi:hypothetical protein
MVLEYLNAKGQGWLPVDFQEEFELVWRRGLEWLEVRDDRLSAARE